MDYFIETYVLNPTAIIIFGIALGIGVLGYIFTLAQKRPVPKEPKYDIAWENDAFELLVKYASVLEEILWAASIEQAANLNPISAEDAMKTGDKFLEMNLAQLTKMSASLREDLDELDEAKLKIRPVIYKIDSSGGIEIGKKEPVNE
jgi:hypothetical protein